MLASGNSLRTACRRWHDGAVLVRFSKVNRGLATVVWPDGLTATVPQYSSARRVPHDLVHYAVEAELRPRYGFWELLAQQAPFSSVTPAKPWSAQQQRWFAKVLRTHRDEMVEAENLGGLANLDPADHGAIARIVKRIWTDRPSNPRPHVTPATAQRIHDRYAEIAAAWEALPEGGELVVHWPPPPADS